MRISTPLYFLLIMTYLGSSCEKNDRSSMAHNLADERIDYSAVATAISNQTAAELSKRYNLYISGSGGGAMFYINKLSLSADLGRPLQIDEARPIIVNCVEVFLRNINANKTIRPYLMDYPFPEKRLDFTIFTKLKKGSKTVSPVCVVTADERGVSYKNEAGKRLNLILQEPYEKALQIVRSNFQLNVDRKGESNSPIPVIYERNLIDFYKGPPYARDLDWELDRYGCAVAKYF